jgi:uncharacterized repeat protein (TIGR03803 family)
MTAYRSVLAALLVAYSLSLAQAQDWTITPIHKFLGAPSDGSEPNAVVGRGGLLYGTTQFGGTPNAGTVFSLTPPSANGEPWIETLLYEFIPEDGGIEPYGLVAGPDGVLYGYAEGGTSHQGVVYSLTPPSAPGDPWIYETLYNFPGGSGGSSPLGEPAVAQGGVLYGTTFYGGTSKAGTVFRLTPPSAPGGAWTHTVLYSFVGGVGNPPVGVAIGPGGVLYGVAADGSALNGVVFSLTPGASFWQYSSIYTFSGGSDGGRPSAALVLGGGGVLYGTTGNGGANGGGVAFSLTPPTAPADPWREAVLYDFPPYTGISGPAPGSLAIGAGGTLYGCTSGSGGAIDNGFVFRLIPPAAPGATWTESPLYSFPPGASAPTPGGVIVTENGVVYGPAYAQSKDVGMVFQLKP